MSERLKCPRCERDDLIEKRKIGDPIGAGMLAGAAAGSLFPVIGTLAGAFIGAGTGLIGGQAVQKKYKCGHCEYKWGVHLESD